MSTQKSSSSPQEQVLRWVGLGAILTAIGLAAARIPGTRVLALLLLGVSIGCAIALVASDRKKKKT